MEIVVIVIPSTNCCHTNQNATSQDNNGRAINGEAGKKANPGTQHTLTACQGEEIKSLP